METRTIVRKVTKSLDVNFADSKKVQALESKYKSLKGLTRGEYQVQFDKILTQVRKNINVLDDIQKSGASTMAVLKDLGFDSEVKNLSNLLMSVKEDFDVMAEVNTLLSRF
jgi:hypothetical protein